MTESQGTKRFGIPILSSIPEWKRALFIKRFWSRVIRTPNCWLWKAHIYPTGYAGMKLHWGGKQRSIRASRFAYELLKGEIPEGLVLDHLCRNRGCVNPDHLEPVTERENIIRGVSPSALKLLNTHCPQGHPFVPENLEQWALKRGKRICSICHRERSKIRYSKDRDRIRAQQKQHREKILQ